MSNPLHELENLLLTDPRFMSDGQLLKNKVLEAGMQPDAQLLKLLVTNEAVKSLFFIDVDGVLVFDKVKFQRYIHSKSFLPDSYTAFKNKLGLTTGTTLVTESKEVVLSWPYKDCVLQGGQSKEDAKHNERFWNQTLASNEIDRLLHPKALANFTRYKKGEAVAMDDITSTDNFLLKGNNLLALHSLTKSFANKIKLIYVDPPFNTGKDSFSYNDRFSHSTWLTFMKNRLEVAKELLSPDGSIFVHLDHNEAHYCKVLMDEVFGRDHFINEIIWCYTGPGSPGMKQFNRKHDNIFWYSKGDSWTFNSDDIRVPSEVHSGGFKGEMSKNVSDGYSLKGKIPEDWWEFAVASRFKVDGVKRTGYNTEKPLKLLERIIKATTNPNDLVLDFFGGSGSTAFVAASLGRRFISIEQMEATIDIAKERLRKSCDFVFAELLEAKPALIQLLANAESHSDLQSVLALLKNANSLNFMVDGHHIDAMVQQLNTLSFDDAYALVCDCIDFNQVYVSYTDVEDRSFAVAPHDIALNHAFYRQNR